MEFSTQVKKYRAEAGLTQEELAERVYVTRQTVSNWENGRSYPDVKSLLLLSSLFQVSLDTLVKGDLETMKEQIKQEDIRVFSRDSRIFTVLLLLVLAAVEPLNYFWGGLGVALWAVLWVVLMVFAVRVDRQKKRHDIQTYREIVAFTEGRQLEILEKAQEVGKRPYQRVLIVLCAAAAAFAVPFAMRCLLLYFLG